MARSKEWVDSNGAMQVASKQGKQYTDDEMRLVFRDHSEAPWEIAIKLGRKPGAIQNMRRWATYSEKALTANLKRNPNYRSRFLDQLRRIATEMKWPRSSNN